MIKDKVAENLAIKARNSMSKYCFTECTALCCRSGHLPLTKKETKLITKEKLDRVKVGNKFMYLFKLNSDKNMCPNLINYKCKIHKQPRPTACKEFPLFLWKNKTVMVSCRCPAVRESKLYPFLSKFKDLGYKLVYRQE